MQVIAWVLVKFQKNKNVVTSLLVIDTILLIIQGFYYKEFKRISRKKKEDKK